MKKRLPAVLLLLLIVGSATALRFSRDDYAFQDRDAIMAPATARHWAGTDELGRDRMVRVAAALLIGLTGATAAAAVTTTMAAAFGLLAAFSPRWVAAMLMFLSDVFLSLPWLFVLMMVRSLLPLTASPLQTAVTTFLVLAALGWPACARAIYRGALALRSADWMMHGHASGLRPRQMICLHLLPHLRPLSLPQFLICIPAFLMAEANLGALGLGVAEPMPSWGAMLLELDNSALLARTHWVYLPIGLLVVVLLILESFTSAAVEGKETQGLKPIIFSAFSARLKSCPDTKHEFFSIMFSPGLNRPRSTRAKALSLCTSVLRGLKTRSPGLKSGAGTTPSGHCSGLKFGAGTTPSWHSSGPKSEAGTTPSG